MTCKEAIYDEDIYDFITDFPLDSNWKRLGAVECYENIENRISIIHIKKEKVAEGNNRLFEYQSIPKIYGLMEMEKVQMTEEEVFTPPAPFVGTALIESGILQVQRPPLNLQGEGVVICMIDTGIDYLNPVFLDESGETRILAIWDQTIENGEPPEGFIYGAEYKKEIIDEAIKTKKPKEIVPSVDDNGHGTAMASVAAGARIKETNSLTKRYPAGFVGAAAKANLVVVKLKQAKQYLKDTYQIPQNVYAYQENDIIQGIRYGDRFAKIFERPVVFCIGLGTNMGDHEGSGALAQYIREVSVKRSRAIVLCGGNEGNAGHHFQGNLKTDEANVVYDKKGQRSMDVEIRVEEGNQGFLLEFWGNLPDAYEVSIRSPGGERIQPNNINIRQSITYEFVYEETKLIIDSSLVEPASGEELILFRFHKPTAGIWTFRVSIAGENYNGIFHMWLPITQFMNRQAYFLRATPYVTLTEPSNVTNPITVTFYEPENKRFSIDSGRGYSRLNNIRPDLAAPGMEIETITGKRSGSCYAAAITAGAIAQFFQWAVIEGNQLFAESRQIQSYFLRGAKRDKQLSYPNREWGYGRLNLEGVFESLINS